MSQSPARDEPSRRSALKLVGAGLAAVGVGSSTALAKSGTAATERTSDVRSGSPDGKLADGVITAPETEDEQDTAQAAMNVTFEDQSPYHGTVYVAEATLSKGGFIALHDASFFQEGPVMGVSEPLSAGTYTQLPVSLDEVPDESHAVSAIVHHDTPSDGVFSYPEDGDKPVVDDNGVVADFGTLSPE